METKVLSAALPEGIELAGQLLRQGELVAIPTETVYGLAANALDPIAVPKIFAVKGRPQDNPLIVHISSIEMWKTLVSKLPEDALTLAKEFWPGPLTIILPKSELVPAVTSAGLDTVGVRMPSHKAALAIIEAAGVPLAGPSANLSGSPSPTEAAHCVEDLSGKIPLIIDGGSCEVGIESTVVSLVEQPIVLRPGAITPQQISAALGKEVAVSHTATSPLDHDEAPQSPGMKYRHYSPKAKVIIVEGERAAFNRFLESTDSDAYALIFAEDASSCPRPYVVYGTEEDSLSQAKGLFGSLRLLDALGARIVYARKPDQSGVGLGVYNRMLRAAGFEVISL